MTDGRIGRSARWGVATTATAALVAVGILTGMPVFVLGGVAPLAYVALVNATGVGEPDIVVHRSVEPERPRPGDEVTVRVEVENVGDGVLPDLRVVDGVPAKLAVVQGSPRAALGLRPGHTESFEYRVVAKRGDHAFPQPRVRVRSLTGADVVTATGEQAGVTNLQCSLPIDAVPLREQTIEFFGPRRTDTPGSGIEFHSTREYRPGDRLTRINWRRYAETGELTTVEFRKAKRATVVLVVDARAASDVAHGVGYPSAIEYSLYAADRAIPPLRSAGNSVGVTALGADLDPVEPTTSRDVRRGRDEVRSAVAPSTSARGASADGGEAIRCRHSGRTKRRDHGRASAGNSASDLRKQLPSEAQVVLLSPVVDEYPLDVARILGAYGHAITVVSPDPTVGGSPGQRVASVRRRDRLVRLREAGARVVDWNPEESLSVALATALTQWVDR